MTSESNRSNGEELLESVLRGEALEGQGAGEAERLRAFVDSCREASRVVDVGGLCEAALAASTREDLSWRGDLRVVTGYVREGIRSSAMLRLAAASLILHLAAIPVVALFMLSGDPALPEFRVETGREPLPFVESSEVELDAPGGLEILEGEETDTLLVENTLRWNRWQLSNSSEPGEGSLGEAPDWLRERAAILWGDGSVGPALRLEEEAGRPPYWLVLEMERGLDRHLVGSRKGSFDEEDRSNLDGVAAMVMEGADAASWLAVATLARAESYGLSTEASADALSLARADFPADHRLRPLIEVDGDVRARLPLDPLWMEALRAVDPMSISEGCLEHIRSVSSPSPR